MPDDFEMKLSLDTRLVRKALRDFRDELFRAVHSAGREASNEILGTKGVKNYPASPSTAPPPFPGYLRGIGYVKKSGEVTKGSERYGTQWNVKSYKAEMKTVLGNRASYAEYLGGENQSTKVNKNIPGKGWRILGDVADEKIGKIRRIYEAWITRALRKVGLM